VGKPHSKRDAAALRFQKPVVYGASLAITLTVFAIVGSLFFLSQYYQTIRGYDTLTAGIASLPQALTFFVVSQQAVRISKRFSARQAISFGIGLASVGMLVMALTFRIDTPYLLTVVGQILLTIGMGVAVSPATNVIMSSVPPERAGVGSAVNDTTRELGGALGVAILGAVMFASYRAGVQHLAAILPQLSSDVIQQISSSIQAAHAVAAPCECDGTGRRGYGERRVCHWHYASDVHWGGDQCLGRSIRLFRAAHNAGADYSAAGELEAQTVCVAGD